MATRDFSRNFPFDSNCKGTLKVDARCDLKHMGTTNPLKVVEITETSFSLLSLEGHTEGKDRKITFRFENTHDRMYLYVHA